MEQLQACKKMIPKKIHFVWIGDMEMPPGYWENVESFRRLNPSWEINVWNELKLSSIASVPDIKDIFWSPASASNWFRLMILAVHGGIYADTDCECKKPLDPLLSHSAFIAPQADGRLCNAVMGAEPSNPWIAWQIEHNAGDCDPHDAAWGVYTATKAPGIVSVLPTSYFYPYDYKTPPGARKVGPDCLIEHRWSGSWTKHDNVHNPSP
jgi:mannosyltransferase OCH1-like enzyme